MTVFSDRRSGNLPHFLSQPQLLLFSVALIMANIVFMQATIPLPQFYGVAGKQSLILLYGTLFISSLSSVPVWLLNRFSTRNCLQCFAALYSLWPLCTLIHVNDEVLYFISILIGFSASVFWVGVYQSMTVQCRELQLSTGTTAASLTRAMRIAAIPALLATLLLDQFSWGFLGLVLILLNLLAVLCLQQLKAITIPVLQSRKPHNLLHVKPTIWLAASTSFNNQVLALLVSIVSAYQLYIHQWQFFGLAIVSLFFLVIIAASSFAGKRLNPEQFDIRQTLRLGYLLAISGITLLLASFYLAKLPALIALICAMIVLGIAAAILQTGSHTLQILLSPKGSEASISASFLLFRNIGSVTVLGLSLLLEGSGIYLAGIGLMLMGIYCVYRLPALNGG